MTTVINIRPITDTDYSHEALVFVDGRQSGSPVKGQSRSATVGIASSSVCAKEYEVREVDDIYSAPTAAGGTDAGSFDSFIESLTANDVEEAQQSTLYGVKKDADRVKYQCQQCAGTGQWSGGCNRHGNAKCNACQGRGYFFTTEATRRNSALKRRANKAATEAAKMADNIAAIGGKTNLEHLRNAAEWSEFASSLLEQHRAGRAWSPKQVAAIQRMLEKLADRRAAKAKAAEQRKAAAPVVNLTPIRDMFEAAQGSGYKRPKYRAEGFILSLAPAHGNNAGHLYVKSEADVYMGKITPDMLFIGTRNSEGSGVEAALAVIAADPKGAAVRYGQRTGTCSCCGRELTNRTSIEAGIGPICASKWSL